MRRSGTVRFARGKRVDPLMALAAIGGITITVLLDLPVRASPFAASDLKTLYASSWCLLHGLDAYSFANLQSVFHAQGIVSPPSWYGHAPVYPPTTLAILTPLTLLSMVHAAYLVTAVSALLMTIAAIALLRYAAENYGLKLPGKAITIGLFAAGPLLAFALSVGNLSIATAGLCIFAFARRERGSLWSSALPLALALLLKSHLAIWMVIALALLPARRGSIIAFRAAWVSLATGILASVALTRGQLGMQIAGLFGVIRSEVAPGGSMNIGSREVLPAVSQITSLHSLLGFWTTGLAGAILVVLLLLGFGAALVWKTRCAMGERSATIATGAWCAFGLLTTYHRAHDATLLLFLIPWLLDRLRHHPRNWQAWAVIVLYAAMSLGPSTTTIARQAIVGGSQSIASFVLLRQVALATLMLFLVLLQQMYCEGYSGLRVKARQSRPTAYQKSVNTVAASDVTAITSQ